MRELSGSDGKNVRDDGASSQTGAIAPQGLLRNLDAPALYELALSRGEALISSGGALAVNTGEHTARAPQDKFIVRDEATDQSVWWENNKAMTSDQFAVLLADMEEFAGSVALYEQNLQACADPSFRLNVSVFTEYAWHSLFIRNLLIRPPKAELSGFAPDFTVIALPSFKANPERHGCRSSTVIAVDVSRKIALIGGTAYAGEIKKAVFGYLNFLLPGHGVLPMHCAANFGSEGSALFFGLSGTGKTTLSSDSSRRLVGDDEHGWGTNGVFNFEGGCYAKAIRLSERSEPEIFAASRRFGSILENVTLDPKTREPDFDDDSVTENTRIAFPIDFLSGASLSGRADHPQNIVMLTCDAFGVLPPIARLSPAQAIYHFLSGYTAKVAGTETGVREPKATFSTCFGAPFMPRHPSAYAGLLRELISAHKVDCWLLNTGWSGGAYGVGARMPIAVTRKLLHAALNGSLAKAGFEREENFNLMTPLSAPGIDSDLLRAEKSWSSRGEFAQAAARLAGMFGENFRTFEQLVGKEVVEGGPRRFAPI
jgi:phosphoenolpyruvate carboxykinase (ATP)